MTSRKPGTSQKLSFVSLVNKMAEDSSDDSQGIPRKSSPKVLIIGGGISGLAAGRSLASAGIKDFQILEASDRLGGRIMSVDLGTYSCLTNRTEVYEIAIHPVFIT